MQRRNLRAAPAALVPALVLVLATAFAADAPPQVKVSFGARNPAATKCSLFTRMDEHGHAGTELQFYTYAQAWFAGRLLENTTSGRRPLDAEGPGRVRAYRELMEFCEKNPEAPFGAAIAALWGDTPLG